jgi:hypothetical protein
LGEKKLLENDHKALRLHPKAGAEIPLALHSSEDRPQVEVEAIMIRICRGRTLGILKEIDGLPEDIPSRGLLR